MIVEADLTEWQIDEWIDLNLIERALSINLHLFLHDQLATESHFVCPVCILGEFEKAVNQS